MPEMKRLVAKKASVREIINGRFVKKSGFESSYVLTTLGRRLSRVRVLGLIVDKFISADEKYATLTLDDATETIRCKAFVNVKLFDGFTKGDLVDVFGKLREYQGEVYIMPEVIQKVNPNFETLRILELEKIMRDQKEKIRKVRELQKQTSDLNELKISIKKIMPEEDAEGILEAQEMIENITEEKEIKSGETKTKILDLIDKLDNGQGADYQDILKKSGLSENDVDFAIQDLLESGVCFEPKPGKIKKI
ncbi:MAG: OB-fold nucleic acid binding domain-containing protein, partial [Candidatus Aenigmatarchaeota archaeon]